MQTWAYPAQIEDQGGDGFLVTFPDVPEVITGGDTLAEVRVNAADALEEAILAYMALGRAIPPTAPRPQGRGTDRAGPRHSGARDPGPGDGKRSGDQCRLGQAAGQERGCGASPDRRGHRRED